MGKQVLATKKIVIKDNIENFNYINFQIKYKYCSFAIIYRLIKIDYFKQVLEQVLYAKKNN